ncbi:uncharacterized protein ANIA_11260 [Aspergillus nidulans FGSC A4]|uniref:Uncharacterized protein n=1 Tax=Emericella nidulans (strain FGSC A4 / ATCC 38163 / CBS 112.46 / NRRL 194 / M139) TaxID=227321 RepID=C8VQ52_EMENI|nr:hypothetical protein [Aspergillus nidulans FGSC A4]CBF90072.1 TPA: hypothetical protein ANIA_11260 [Aspergillus nidulans FGSC A4]
MFWPYERLSPQIGRQRQRITPKGDETHRVWLVVPQYGWLIFLDELILETGGRSSVYAPRMACILFRSPMAQQG